MADAPTTPKQYFEEKIAKKLQDRPDISKSVNSVYEFNITGDNGGVWTVDLTTEPGAVTSGSTGTAKCTVTCAAGDFMNIVSGKMNPQMAFMSGKLSIAVDLKAPEGASLLRRLCARADVLVEGFRPGVLARLGCAPEALLAEFPRLIVCSLSGFGQTGPLRDRAGHDIGYVAASGVLSRCGLGDVPALPGAQIADFLGGGLQAVIAVLAAIVERATTGRGRL